MKRILSILILMLVSYIGFAQDPYNKIDANGVMLFSTPLTAHPYVLEHKLKDRNFTFNKSKTDSIWNTINKISKINTDSLLRKAPPQVWSGFFLGMNTDIITRCLSNHIIDIALEVKYITNNDLKEIIDYYIMQYEQFTNIDYSKGAITLKWRIGRAIGQHWAEIRINVNSDDKICYITLENSMDLFKDLLDCMRK